MVNHAIMNERENKLELLLKTFYKLVNAIMSKTDDPESDLRFIMADNINGFGTGKHEIFNSCDEFIEKIYRVFGNQLPAEAHVHFLNLQSTMLDTVGIVHGPYEISYMLEGIENRFYMRRTVVFTWVNGHWRAIHLHVSDPSAHLAEGESWPVRALKAQNEELKKQVEIQTEKLSRSLSELQATQQQLILSAKMASLGELTAGIAHEIQNPLNFVNNFSEVSNELIDEMKEGIEKGDINEVKAIATDVKQNLEKILHHGKRADGIVKGMLQHSRSSAGQKELTDINILADEYLRLAYHGLRAKDKSFNAKFETDFDSSIEKINVMPQEIGRVILNLINNAFYAVTEKKKQNGNARLPDGQGYEPTVIICTMKLNNKIMIKVKDNGNGVPQKVMDKIFQPFFTTKPAGQGTGLGLSLSYDIVKAHGGDLKVETQEGKGAEFIIQLPIN